MGLFSNLDWVILLGVGAFLLLGRENGALLRQLGRWYGRAMRLKQELLDEVTKAADLPAGVALNPPSIRRAFLGSEEPLGRVSGIPAAVTAAPTVIVRPSAAPDWSGASVGPLSWSFAEPARGLEAGGGG